jgi:DNA topoisomerase IA
MPARRKLTKLSGQHISITILSDGESNEKRLYELIWKRAIASQMSEAQFEKTTAKISISTRKEDLTLPTVK